MNPMLTAYSWNDETKQGVWLTPEKLQGQASDLRCEPHVLWIDLEHPTAEEEALVYEQVFKIHPLTHEDITKPRREPGGRAHFPKVEEFADYLFVIVNPLSEALLVAVRDESAKPSNFEQNAATQLSVLLTERVLITHHYEPLPSIHGLRTFLDKHKVQAGRGPDYLFHLILDAMVDQYAEVLDHFDSVLENIEEQVFLRQRQQLLQVILQVKREVITLRKTLVYEREVLARLARGEFALIDPREMVYYRNVYDHIVRFTELIESSREMVTDLMQTHLAATSNRLSEVMKTLTMISTVVLPMSLIAGIYGMNFKNMPEIEWPLGYYFALGIMLALGVGSFAFFRWKKWL